MGAFNSLLALNLCDNVSLILSVWSCVFWLPEALGPSAFRFVSASSQIAQRQFSWTMANHRSQGMKSMRESMDLPGEGGSENVHEAFDAVKNKG